MEEFKTEYGVTYIGDVQDGEGYETLYHEAQIHTNILNGILTEYEKRKKML